MAEFPISGQIDPKAFPFLLMDLHRQNATGSLKVDGPSYQKALYYRNGRILFGSSNDPRDQLGAILIEAGKISPEQLEDVNAKVGPGNPLAKALADSGYVSQRELSDAARAKVERILSDLLGYESGSFEFEDGVLPKGAVDLKLSAEKLVVNAVRRVADRGFVLRHLGGMDVRLSPTPALATHVAEIRAECAGLAEQFDGRRALKEAAAQTRLDEFEAAKIASALLFLGMVQKGAPAADVVMPEPEPLDLANTARMAFEVLPQTLSMPAPGGDAEPTIDPAFFAAPKAEPRTEPVVEPPTVIGPPLSAAPATGFAIVEPAPSGSPEPPRPQPVPPPAPPPPAPRAPAPKPPAAAVATQPAGPLPIIPPPPRAPAQRRGPEIEVPPSRPPTRPSKQDLEALDALLQSRPHEGPLTPFEKPPAPSREVAPRFEPAGRQGGVRGGGVLTPVLLGAAAALLIGGGVAVWYLLLRAPAQPRQAQASPRPQVPATPRAAPTTLAATPAPAPSTVEPGTAPTSVAPAAAPTQAPGTVLAPATPAVAARETPRPSPPAPAPPTPADARGLLQRGAFSEAARAFASTVRAAQAGYTVQILVACSDDTVRKALENVQAQELYILPVNYRGRNCYRVLWGLYETAARADSATRAVPEYFRQGGARPKVVTTASVLP
jgi:hypothetical protein